VTSQVTKAAESYSRTEELKSPRSFKRQKEAQFIEIRERKFLGVASVIVICDVIEVLVNKTIRVK